MKLLTRKEAADRLGVTEQTIINYCRQKLLTPLYPAGVPGKKVMFAEEEITNFFKPPTVNLLTE